MVELTKMGPQPPVPASAPDYSSAKNAKDLLDMIGKDVYETVKNGVAEKYKDDLKGNLQYAKGSGETVTFPDTCRRVKEYYDGVNGVAARGERYPCRKSGEDVKRFSDKRGAQCDDRKIRGSNSNKDGACAPFRRLNLCNKNMEKIATSMTTHKLLAEVCMAAYYEGDSIKTHYTPHKEKYNDTGTASQLCTVLARSFADIGDIIRGKDLYLGNPQESTQRQQLDDKLKGIFKKIHEDVTTNGKNKDALKTRYNDDAKGGHFYQLREDWWNANRHTVWEALTCEDDDKKLSNASYFRQTCNYDGTLSDAIHKCRCRDDRVPTYFDYVPQYLRWFDEWAEDFCRKKKKKLENLDTQCRGFYNKEPRYCSRNGYDCTRTIYKKRYFVIDKGCINCLYACNPYVEWIEKQKEQFDKQVKKYDEEIKKYKNEASGSSRRQTRSAPKENYEGYEKIFYDKLKGGYEKVDKFLQKLNKEDVCTKITDEKEGRISFENVKSSSGGDSGTNDKTKGTFYRSEYCQPCPPCGVERKVVSGWEEKKNGDCDSDKHYKIKDGAQSNDINVLSFGDKRNEIKQKIDTFCKTPNGNGGKASSIGSGDCGSNSDSSLCEKWTCYEEKDIEKHGDDDEVYNKEVKGAGGICILEKTNSEENGKKQKTFNNFFYYWVAHMLKDSIHWRTKKLVKCLKNGNTIKCGMNCKDDCGCFERWVEQKREEWRKIVQHFKTQEAFKNGGGNGTGDMLGGIMQCPDFVLQYNLQEEFLKKDSTEDKENKVSAEEAKELKHLREMLKEIGGTGVAALAGLCTEVGVAEQNTIMDKLLDYEKKIATKCKNCEQSSTPEGGARAETPSDGPQAPADSDVTNPTEATEEEEEEEDDDDDFEEDAEEEVKATGQGEEEKTKEEKTEDGKAPEAEGPKETTKEVNPCDIVSKLFQNPNDFSDACKLKYGPKAPTGWKCVAPSGVSTATGSESESPPRQRRSAETATGGETTGKSDASGSVCIPPRRRKLYIHDLQSLSGEDGKAPSQEDLLKWFVKSAAVETFFLWHKYKMEKKPPAQEGAGHGLPLAQEWSPEDDPEQKELEKGDIPENFLRQMFYTLGDYRDIVVRGGGDDTNVGNNIVVNASGNKEDMDKIQKKIDEILNKQSGNNKGTIGTQQQNSSLTRETLWNEHAEPIWNGMICALTYKETSVSGDKGVKIEQNQQLKDQLLESDGKKPKDTYKYDKVKLDENSGTEAKPNGDPASGENTPLSKFVLRPPYFRYLEEWGETFCRQRKRMLEKIRGECMEDGSRGELKQKYSGDGESCETIRKEDYSKVSDLESSSCPKSCSSYRRWIERKNTQYDKQQNAYSNQKENCKKGSDNGFCETLEKTCNTAAEFLKRLKNGACKNDNENGGSDITFDDSSDTFQHTDYCGTCSLNGFKCNGDDCRVRTNVTCNGSNRTTTITAKDIETMEKFTQEITMLVIDDNATGFKDVLPECKEAGIFKGIRKDEWKCGNLCKSDVCGLKKNNNNNNNNNDIDDKQIILIRALFKRWIEYFLEDYNKIRKKLNPCINNGEKAICTNGCVEQWISTKKEEWENIKTRFIEQYNYSDTEMKSSVKNFLETLITQIAATIDKGNYDSLEKLVKSVKCNCGNNSQNAKEGEENDLVKCLFQKLQVKANKCKEKHQTCTDPQPQTPHLPDDEEEIPEENPVEAPKICGEMTTQQDEEKEEGGCVPAKTEPEASAESAEPQEEPPAAPPKKPEEPPPKVPEQTKENKKPKLPKPQEPPDLSHPLKTALMSSTIMWSIGIGFAAFTYFFLKVLYIYMWMCFFYMYLWGMFGYIYIYIYVDLHVCVLYIYFIYMYLY